MPAGGTALVQSMESPWTSWPRAARLHPGKSGDKDKSFLHQTDHPDRNCNAVLEKTKVQYSRPLDNTQHADNIGGTILKFES